MIYSVGERLTLRYKYERSKIVAKRETNLSLKSKSESSLWFGIHTFFILLISSTKHDSAVHVQLLPSSALVQVWEAENKSSHSLI